jgi:hypothetical protein
VSKKEILELGKYSERLAKLMVKANKECKLAVILTRLLIRKNMVTVRELVDEYEQVS